MIKWIGLLVCVWIISEIPGGRASTSDCICTCCVPRSGVCLSETEGNFTVSSCQDQCTEETCQTKFSVCRAPGVNIQTKCSSEVSAFDTFLITVALFLIGLLTVLSALQYKSKVIRSLFPVRDLYLMNSLILLKNLIIDIFILFLDSSC